MSEYRLLILPDTYEDLRREVGDEITKMTQFVVPVEESEKQLAIITQSIRYSGKMVFLLGKSGIGKSTFIRSLTWRKFVPIPEITEIDADRLGAPEEKLEHLYQKLEELVATRRVGEQGLFTVVINYLEDFAGISDEKVKAFFRDLNGLLRRETILIIWPVTEKAEAQKMVLLVNKVSSTLFASESILNFNGPPKSEFPAIAKRTIAILNQGMSIEDFQLSEVDFEDAQNELGNKFGDNYTIREYLQMIKSSWSARSGEVGKILATIPKFTEVWFVICYPEAANVIDQFVRKSTDPELAWNADIRKFSEYIGAGTQKAAIWNQRRLMQAMQGFFKVKVLYIPTNALVSCVARFGSEKDKDKYGNEIPIIDSGILDEVRAQLPHDKWREKDKAIRFLGTSPLVYQLKGQGAVLGHRRGNLEALEKARASFSKINQYVSSRGEGSDTPINKALARSLRTVLDVEDDVIVVEQTHPWLPSIQPDIMFFPELEKVICIEMHYTADPRPSTLANYVLKKMDIYMRQLEAYMEKPQIRLPL